MIALSNEERQTKTFQITDGLFGCYKLKSSQWGGGGWRWLNPRNGKSKWEVEVLILYICPNRDSFSLTYCNLRMENFILLKGHHTMKINHTRVRFWTTIDTVPAIWPSTIPSQCNLIQLGKLNIAFTGRKWLILNWSLAPWLKWHRHGCHACCSPPTPYATTYTTHYSYQRHGPACTVVEELEGGISGCFSCRRFFFFLARACLRDINRGWRREEEGLISPSTREKWRLANYRTSLHN